MGLGCGAGVPKGGCALAVGGRAVAVGSCAVAVGDDGGRGVTVEGGTGVLLAGLQAASTRQIRTLANPMPVFIGRICSMGAP